VETGEHDIRHEPTDIEPRSILRLSLVVGAVLVLTVIALLPLFSFYARREARQDPPPGPLAPAEKGREFPTPRLQVRPFADIRQLRAQEKELLESYGWVDEGARIVRIPIEQAMKLTAQRGLPVRQASPAPPPSPSPSRPAVEGEEK
jgi:hypothetical protein